MSAALFHYNTWVLHYAAPERAYGFVAGFNPAAIIALLAGFGAYLAVLEPVRQTPAAGFRHLSATLPSMALAFAVHLALSRMVTIPRGLGGYRRGPGKRDASLPELPII